MFLIVGEILKNNLEWWRNDMDRWIVKEFWELMEKKGYIHIEDLERFRNDINGRSNSKFLDLNSQISVIISRGAHIKYTKEFLEKFSNLKYILLAQIGNDNVDLEYCKQKGIEVKNFVSQKSIYSVAEQTISGLIWGIRQIYSTGCNLKNWNYSRNPIWKNLENFTIWIMGCGRIWQKVIEFLKVFSCKVITYDIVFWFEKKEDWLINLEKKLNSRWIKTYSDLDSFLNDSDYISVHIPWFSENLRLLDYEKLKKISWVVNMARAGIVVEEDVLKLLDEWKMEFYVSDVVEWEPYIEKINQKLINHPKVFVTPHIGANTIQVQEDILGLILEFLKNNVV